MLRYVTALMLGLIAVVVPAVAQIPEAAGEKLPTLAPVVREVSPSVVNISVRGGRQRHDRHIAGRPTPVAAVRTARHRETAPAG
jgi:hypothetical protein